MEADNLELGVIDIIEEVDIQETVQLLLHCVEDETNHTNHSSPSISMVPSVFRDLSPHSFEPQLVSIGPLHKEDVNVQAFEGQKSSYLTTLMSRFDHPIEEIMKLCTHKVYTSMDKIKACYAWTKTKKYTDAEIAQMMVRDACFILEFSYQIHVCRVNVPLGGRFLIENVMCDLILLENQIPFFILDELFQCTILKFDSNISLIELIRPILNCHKLFEADLKVNDVSVSTTPHILSLLHQCYTPPDNIKKSFITSSIQSAIDLDIAGVNFKPINEKTWAMGMVVKQDRLSYLYCSISKPTLRMPVLRVHDFTEFIIRNLIAFEQQTFQTQSFVRSYAFAMDMLVNTQEDVAKLVESRVLINMMGSNKEAANMINNICKNVLYCSFYVEEWEKLNKYCNGYWRKHITRMRSTYFNSPWSIIALLAGIIIFVLQIVQTIFTIKSAKSEGSKK